MTERVKMSDHFYLDELTVSQTAAAHGIDNTPLQVHLINMRTFLVPGLEKVRHICGDRAMVLTNAYRSPRVNAMVGGTTTSAHPQGYAGDIHVAGLSDLEVYRILRAAIHSGALKCDQLILEDHRCVHVSFDPRYRGMCGHQPGAAGTAIDWNFQ